MKTAISIPDDLFGEAEALAAKLKTSRSQLYCRAVREYVARHSDDSITDALNEVYAAEAAPDEFASRAAAAAVGRSEW